MSLTYSAAVEQTITAGEQIHQIVNGTATTEVTVEDGSKVPSIRKALLDNFYFKDPITWQVGQSENVFNQLRQFTDGSWWYAPSATASNPISMGSTPVGDSLWKIYDFDAIGKLTPQIREALRRSYAEAGYNLVAGSFEAGGTVTTATDVLLYGATGVAYSYSGALPKAVSAGSSPSSTGGVGAGAWIPRTDVILRNELKIKTPETFRGAPSPEDSTSAFNLATSTPIQVPDNLYQCNPGQFTVAAIVGRAKSKLKQLATSGNFLGFRAPVGGRIANLDIEANKGGNSAAQGHQIDIKDGNDVTLENLNFTGVEGPGFSILSYPSTQPYQAGFIVKSIRGKYTKDVVGADAGCVLLAKNRFSLVDGVIGTGYPQFGSFELKDDARYNIATNIIGSDCENTVYLGTESALNPNTNIISNVLSNKPGYSAVNMQSGHHNLVTNVLADYSSSEATQAHGVTVSGDANVCDNVYMMGVTGTTPLGVNQAAYHARFRDTAKENYASIFPHYTAAGVVVFAVGTTRNFVEMKHPGSRSDIFAIGATIGGKTTVTGDQSSNVVHCPATGQYFGTMSGRYEWRIKDIPIPASTLFSTDRYRMMADGTVSLAVGGGTTAQLKLFNSDGTFRTMSYGTNQSVRLDIGNSNYLQFGLTTLTPNQTNTYTLGSASNAWAGGFTQTAFTVTSDERAKTPLTEISDAMLDACEEVQIGQYQLLDRVAEKGGDGARWHFGVIAQRFVEAFQRHGLDPYRFAFICYDKWDAAPDQYRELTQEELESGEYPAMQTSVLVEPAREGGDRYGIRYEEMLCLEAALQRRNYQRLLNRIEVLEGKV